MLNPPRMVASVHLSVSEQSVRSCTDPSTQGVYTAADASLME